MDSADAEAKIKRFVSLQGMLEKAGIKDHEVACAAAFILDNIAKGYPTADLVTAWPFNAAYEYLASAGLVAGERSSLHMTEAGSQAYNLEPRKIYFVQ